MNVRPFLIASPVQLESLRRHLLDDVHRWADTWFGAKAEEGIVASVAMHPEPRPDVAEASFYQSRLDTSWAIVGSLPQVTRQLGCRLMAGDGDSLPHPTDNPLLDDVACSALADLVCHLLHAAADDEYHLARTGALHQLIPGDARRPGAGVLQLEIELPVCALLVWLPLQSIAALHGNPHPPPASERALAVSLEAAVARQPVHAEVVLGQAEVSVGTLAGLRVGDVIGLDKSLDEPLCLRFDESPSEFAVWLGRCGQNMAVRIDDLSGA